MISVPVHSKDGDLVRQIEVEESLFGGEVNRDLLRQAIIAHEANQRAGTAKAKTRGEVAHSNKKPWRQKGTGRARSGSRNSPVWVGGGVAMGPKPRDYSQKLNKKMRRKSVRVIGLSEDVGELIARVDDWSVTKLIGVIRAQIQNAIDAILEKFVLQVGLATDIKKLLRTAMQSIPKQTSFSYSWDTPLQDWPSADPLFIARIPAAASEP